VIASSALCVITVSEAMLIDPVPAAYMLMTTGEFAKTPISPERITEFIP
jgi:hypothetical protein